MERVEAVAKKKLDLNEVLVWANVIVLFLTVVAFLVKGSNRYLDANTILLAIVLAIQTHIALFFEKRRRDPFVILFALTMVLYFSFRIFTLCIYPFSVVFQRGEYGAGDSNFALIFIVLANAFLYLGFYAVKRKVEVAVSGNWVARRVPLMLIFIAVSILVFYTKEGFWTSDNVPRVVKLLENLISPTILLVMVVSYCLLLRKSLNRWTIFAVIALLAVDATLHTFTGSRGAIVESVTNCIIVVLAVAGAFAVSRKTAIAAAVMLPAIFVLLMTVFTFASIVRGTKAGETSPYANFARAVRLLSTPELKLSNSDQALPAVFDRIGFFDYSAEIIAHKAKYAPVINLEAYAKSLVDNLLTPGFDIFDQPKIGNSLMFVNHNLGRPSKLFVMKNYQSDQLGMYGEFYMWLGFASLPLFFLAAYFFKKLYTGLKSDNPFHLVLKRAFILYFFLRIVNSFGLDWIIYDVLVFTVCVYLYLFLFQVKRNNQPSRQYPAASLGNDEQLSVASDSGRH